MVPGEAVRDCTQSSVLSEVGGRRLEGWEKWGLDVGKLRDGLEVLWCRLFLSPAMPALLSALFGSVASFATDGFRISDPP
jgi:hypothetical protein